MTFTRTIDHECPVCEVVHATYKVICDKQMEPLYVHELCQHHQILKDEGSIFVLEIREPNPLASVDYDTAERTGKVLVIEKILADGLYEAEVDADEHGIVMVDEDTFKQIHRVLKSMPGLEECDEH